MITVYWQGNIVSRHHNKRKAFESATLFLKKNNFFQKYLTPREVAQWFDSIQFIDTKERDHGASQSCTSHREFIQYLRDTYPANSKIQLACG